MFISESSDPNTYDHGTVSYVVLITLRMPRALNTLIKRYVLKENHISLF